MGRHNPTRKGTMYSGTRTTQTGGYGGDPFSEEGEHKGIVVSVSFPYHERHLVEELDKQVRMNCCSSRSHNIRRLIRKEAIEQRRAEEQHSQWVSLFGEK